MKIKICGLITSADVELMKEVTPDYAGVVLFFPKSKRNRSLDEAEKILRGLPEEVTAVAVTVSPSLEQAKQIEKMGFAVLQIHGDLRPEIMRETNLSIWRAFNGSNLEELDEILANSRIEGIVFDAARPGSGKAFDWKQLPDLTQMDKLCILAGGLTPENVAEAIQTAHPDVVDVSSGVEYEDTIIEGKNPEKVRAFVKSTRAR